MFDLYCRRLSLRSTEKEKEKEKEREKGRRKRGEETEKEEKEEEEMTMPMAMRMATDGEGTQCPHHPQGSRYVCVEAAHSLAMSRRWVACHNRLKDIQQAMNGDREDRWALEHPSPTPDIQVLMGLPPVAGWVCTPRDDFVRETQMLTAESLQLAQLQLEWEKEEEERRRLATPVSTPYQVSGDE